ncbi:hypothetical protein MO867_20175 [Microbulbifer sp. OS29]|uniref:Uncharacterized protein n=1 Tax=Microbulbifer okhotskensis TaxID=2926617 RepID=A0A9X2J9H3_9GAMM|nr:hypothetical protein [Microbulbifer okhotskensis]MCO1336646.1 hypothetical protein [Microbulbifer okhotskensis]
MSATVFVHPTAMTQRSIDRLQRRTGQIAIADHQGRRVRLVQPKPALVRPSHDDWPPFGGDAA